MSKKPRLFEKPFEGCIETKDKKFTDIGFHDVSAKDDDKFIRAVKRLKEK